MRSDTAKDLLAETDRARSKTRAGRRGAWLHALFVFGVLVITAAPQYVVRRMAAAPRRTHRAGDVGLDAAVLAVRRCPWAAWCF